MLLWEIWFCLAAVAVEYDEALRWTACVEFSFRALGTILLLIIGKWVRAGVLLVLFGSDPWMLIHGGTFLPNDH